MKLNVNDIMNVVQQVKLENRSKTKVKFVGEIFITSSDKEGDYLDLSCSIIKSTKLIYGTETDILEIEIG